MAKFITKEELIEKINHCDAVISNQIEKKKKLQEKLDKLNQQEILNAILNSGKSLEDILNIINQ